MLEEALTRFATKKNPNTHNFLDIMLVLKTIIAAEPKFALKHLFSTHCLHLFIKTFDCLSI